VSVAGGAVTGGAVAGDAGDAGGEVQAIRAIRCSRCQFSSVEKVWVGEFDSCANLSPARL